MNAKLFSPKTKWIWIPDPARENNTFACFRKTITITAPDPRTVLHITADSRYEVYINGHLLGHGPIRSFTSPWPVDRYEIGHLLRKGANTIAVLVQHFGLSTFQYLHSTPGLIAEVTIKGKKIPTDATWKCIEHHGYAWPVPRISCQQGWEEQFDARVHPGSPEIWTAPDFDDRKWPRSVVVKSEHARFEPREVPFLTSDPVSPVAVRDIESVQGAPYTFNLNPHDFLNKEDRTANHIRGSMLLTTTIHSPRTKNPTPPTPRPPRRQMETQQRGSELHRPHPPENRYRRCPRQTQKRRECSHVPVAGDRTFLVGRHQRVDRRAGEIRSVACLRSLQIRKTPGLRPHPCRAQPAISYRHAQRFDVAWNRGELSKDDLTQAFARLMTNDMVVTTDIYALSASERRTPNAELRVDNPTSLLSDNDDWTTIHPSKSDVRLLLDFGHELVGPHEFELDAPASTIIDNHNFEFIQRDGRYNLAEGMNNSFRYICREGVQKYRTFVRRGFRYSWFTFRNFDRPVRIRHIRALFSTYPQTGAGSFESSDALLNDIWRAGVLSVRCCSEDTYTDCPSYEQTFWVGDARNEAMVDLIANGDPRLSAHSLKLAGRSLDRSPIVESQVPSGWQNLLTTWSFLWMRWAQEHFHFTGDKAFAKEILPFVIRNIEGITSNINELGLFKLHAWNLFDWAGMDTPAAGIVTHVNCFAVQGLRQCADLAKQIGEPSKSKSWLKLADQLESAINKHLWSDEKQAYVDCIRPDGTPSKTFSQQTQTAAYVSGVAKGDRETRCREIVHYAPEGFITAGSPFYMFFLLEALAREGRTADLLSTIRSYWGKQIQAGATTFWEMFHEDEPRLTRSHCHGWSAAPVVFLTQYILGIRPLSPGYAQTLIAPPPDCLPFVEGTVPTPHGPVSCYWTDDKDRFTLRLSLPQKITARIELPYEGELQIHSGKLAKAKGAMTARGPELHLTLRKS